MKAPQVIETRRLLLRPPQDADADRIFERYANDPEVTRYLSWPQHQSCDDTRAFIEFSKAEWLRWPAGPYLVFTREHDTLLGGTGLRFETPHLAETGYVFAQDSWARGYATETLQAIVEVAARMEVRRLVALCHPENRPSRRVLEKCGFQRRGMPLRYAEFPNLRPGEPTEVLCYEKALGR